MYCNGMSLLTCFGERLEEENCFIERSIAIIAPDLPGRSSIVEPVLPAGT